MQDQQFAFEFEPSTQTIFFNAHYPAGHDHRTSFTLDELDAHIEHAAEVARQARRRFGAIRHRIVS